MSQVNTLAFSKWCTEYTFVTPERLEQIFKDVMFCAKRSNLTRNQSKGNLLLLGFDGKVANVVTFASSGIGGYF